jgi:HEPN domain-containing protein
MQPLDPETRRLLSEWIEKAGADLSAARSLAAEAGTSLRIREIVGFHCQQAAEKYLKGLLTRWQIEFPKTHDIQALLSLVGAVDTRAAAAMRDARWLTPFGVEVRWPGDATEMLPGDEVRAIEIAAKVERTALEILSTA